MLPVSLVTDATTLAVVSATILAISITLQLPLIRCFARARGILFAIGGWAFQQVNLTYSAVTFVGCRIFSRLVADSDE
jgi:hypothetical protein